MAYREKRKALIEKLKREGRIKTDEVEKAFLEVPREEFVSEAMRSYAYVDTPLEIGNGQTISAPHMVAIMCEALDIKKGQKILEIGTGSGYHAAIVSKLVGESGHVYTVERFSLLAEKAQEHLEIAGVKNITIEVGDGSEGFSEHAPYERIYVTCAAPKTPRLLVDQLSDPGKLMVPVGRFMCELKLIEKKEGKLIEKDLGGCAFVPLVGKHGF
ncbi:MAG: protein-L-isoaspartate O-methyltransferase [Candidatus Thermoplasmatota archaeon]|nr:protein-L-isoaspartate O-methyltransferase [Candidatus Thermoplasmatota archaeon]